MTSFPTIFNADQFCADLLMLLQSSYQLSGVNVQQWRKMRLQPNVNWMTLVQTPNSLGKCGNGVLVLEPYANSQEQGVSGAIFDWVFPIACMELPVVNDDATVGDGRTAYRLAQLVIDVAHIHADDLYGTLRVMQKAISDEDQFELPGCVGKRVEFHITGKSTRTPAVNTITISQSGEQITLSCSSIGASIYYTQDGSWPSNSTKINPATTLYTAPFTTSTGTIIRATGFLNNMNCSETRSITAT